MSTALIIYPCDTKIKLLHIFVTFLCPSFLIRILNNKWHFVRFAIFYCD